MKKLLFPLAAALLAVLAYLWLRPAPVTDAAEEPGRGKSAALSAVTAAPASAGATGTEDAPGDAAEGESDAAEKEAARAEEAAAEEEEKRVNAFDALTDKYLEPAPAGVSMAEVADFVRAFKEVPQARRSEGLHRALNLIPDENVMLLAGILMDKAVEKEEVELVYNDILNRDEDVKRPILQEIFKDKTHPCWADTAWILDVTGETPAKK